MISGVPLHRIRHAWIEAVAGSGKTSLLLYKIVWLFLEGQRLSSIACMTFTNKAADELCDRLRILAAQLYTDTESTIKRIFGHRIPSHMLNRAKALQDTLTIDPPFIGTLHSFAYTWAFLDKKNITMLHDEAKKSLWCTIASTVDYDDDPVWCAAQRTVCEAQKKSFLHCIPWLYEHKITARKKVPAGNVHNSVFYTLLADMENHVFTLKEKEMLDTLKKIDPLSEECVSFLLTQKKQPRIFRYVQNPALKQTVEAMQEWVLKRSAYDTEQKKHMLYEAVLYLRTMFEKHYVAYKKIQGWYDFEDLVQELQAQCDSISTMGNLTEKIARKYEHIMVDEGQDLSPTVWKMIFLIMDTCLFQGRGSLTIVSDPQQCIYGFNGASTHCHEYAKKNIKQWMRFHNIPYKEFIQNTSWRFSTPIVSLINTFFHHPTFVHHKIPNARCGLVKHIPYGPNSTEEQRVAIWEQNITQWSENPFFLSSAQRNHSLEDILILFPYRNNFFYTLWKHFWEKGWITHHVPPAEPVVMLLKALLLWMHNPHDDMALYKILNSPLATISLRDHQQSIRDRGRISLWSWFLEHNESKIWKLWQNVPGTDHDRLAWFLYTQGYAEKIVTFYGTRASHIIHAFMVLLREWPKRTDVQAFIDLLEKGLIIPAKPRIRVSTIHGAKGTEAPIVILANLSLAPPQSIRNTAEEERLLYVAFSRAQDLLFIGEEENNPWLDVLKPSLYHDTARCNLS